DNPALHPIGFQAAAGLQEVGSSGSAVVSWIARSMTLQAGCRRAAEEAPRHLRFFRGQQRNLFRYVGEGLARQRLEETHQLAQLIFGKRERWHAYLQVRAHAVAIGV